MNKNEDSLKSLVHQASAGSLHSNSLHEETFDGY